ncbi:hypothetical protein EW145_g8303, partial [Phellinidium pouzarii]
ADIREFTPSSWRSLIGVVPQDPVLFTGTIASNIAFGNLGATREQIEEAARQANCEFVWGMPHGFDTEIGRLSLSGGQRQRLAIARALLKKPAILAMDEATSSLDAASEYRVNDAIDKILSSRRTTCLIVAHRLSTIARAERIVVLEDGKITESGTYRQLVSRPNSRFRTLMAAQLDTTTADMLVSSNASPESNDGGDDNDSGFDYNPILEMQPAFARSLPVQILLDGVVFALTAVLLVHLLFTAQYHWPLAPVNYVLQLAGVLSLFISLIATICVVLTQAFRDSQQWPYMLTYLAVPVPPTLGNSTSSSNGTSLAMVYEPDVWSTAELAAWYVMDATTSALVQFLTLLYPSYLEARLILGLLAPLAVLSAAMELLPIHQSQTIVDIADTIRNTCNAALSLLFTAALCLWGFLVNRKQAWRTDGGTAAFGAAAIVLALISTALNFLYIPAKDQYTWLPHLIWVVVLWQSFLGWWWWVGGGRGVGEVEELLWREERRDRKRKARAARRSVRREKAQALWRNASESLGFIRKGNAESEAIEMVNVIAPDNSSFSAASTSPPMASSSTTANNTNAGTNGLCARIWLSPPLLAVSHFYHLLRRAHLAA